MLNRVSYLQKQDEIFKKKIRKAQSDAEKIHQVKNEKISMLQAKIVQE